MVTTQGRFPVMSSARIPPVGGQRPDRAGRARRRPFLSHPVASLTPCPSSHPPSGRSSCTPTSPPPATSPRPSRQLAKGVDRGDALPDPARHHRLGQERHHRLDHRAGPAARRWCIAPNKSLAAQLANEFKEFFPDNRVEYFVSYYDYYQPEAYIPSSRHVHREGRLDQRRDRPAAPLRHRGAAHPARRDRRGLGVAASTASARPRSTRADHAAPRAGRSASTSATILRRLVDMQYERNDMNLVRGKFRVRGDTIEVHPAYEEIAVRIELFGDEIERITQVDPLTGERLDELDDLRRLPGHPLRHRRGAAQAGHRAASRPSSSERLAHVREARASSSRPSGCACAPSTTSR